MAALLAALQDRRLLARSDDQGELVVRWSPHQKIEYLHTADGRRRIYVNGIFHQHMDRNEDLGGLPSGIPYTLPRDGVFRSRAFPYATEAGFTLAEVLDDDRPDRGRQ